MANNTNTTIIFPNFFYEDRPSPMFNTNTNTQILETVTKFILNQSIETVIMLSVLLTLYYLGFQNRKIKNSRIYYKELYKDAYIDCIRLEDTIMLLRKKVKSLEIRLNRKRRELQYILDIDNEKPADDGNSGTISNKKRKNKRLPFRGKPKRSAAPIKFVFGESDSEDNKMTDPDYKI